MTYSLGASIRSPARRWVPSEASRRSNASSSVGTIEPPSTRAKRSLTAPSSARSRRDSGPRWDISPIYPAALRQRFHEAGRAASVQVGGASRVGERMSHRDTLSRSSGRVAEWQTRWLQVPVSFGTWGFKSPFAHNRQHGAGNPQRVPGLAAWRACCRSSKDINPRLLTRLAAVTRRPLR